MDSTGQDASTPTRPAALVPATVREYLVTSSGPVPCRLEANVLIVPPFRLSRRWQTYISDAELRIDLSRVDDGRYRILAVHNFHVEDRNPRLDECVAGVFLAAWCDNGRWEEPERFPVECRTLAILGELAILERVDTEAHP